MLWPRKRDPRRSTGWRFRTGDSLFVSQLVLEDHSTELPDLIWLRMASVALQNNPFGDSLLTENMVTASLSLGKAQFPKQSTQGVEADIRV